MTRAAPRGFALGLVAVLTVAARESAAEDDAEKLQQALRLYEEGTALLDQKRYDEACPRLEQAVELVPIGSGSQLALGACYEATGRLGSALLRYERAAALASAAGQADRAKRASEAATAIAPRVARLTIAVEASARSAADLVVRIDGAPVPSASWGKPYPVDAGERLLEATATGRLPFEEKLTIRDGESRATTVALTLRPADPTPPPSPVQAPVGGGDGGTLQPLGLVVGGVGIAGLGLGAVTGALAIGKKSDGDVGCDGNACPPPALAAREDGLTFATISTVGFVAGGVLLAGGVVLFVLGAPDEGGTTTARLTAGPGALRFEGAF